jgi:hypothetical protein
MTRGHDNGLCRTGRSLVITLWAALVVPFRSNELRGGRRLHPCPCPARQGGLGSRGSSLTRGCDRRRDGDRGVRRDRPVRVPNLHDLDLFPDS